MKCRIKDPTVYAFRWDGQNLTGFWQFMAQMGISERVGLPANGPLGGVLRIRYGDEERMLDLGYYLVCYPGTKELEAFGPTEFLDLFEIIGLAE